MHRLKERPKGVEGTELEELYKEALYAGWPAEKRKLYEKYAMNRNDYGNILEERFEDGMAAGMAKGLAEGLAEGVNKGKTEVIRKMLAAGIPASTIADALGITIDECLAYRD